MDKLYSREDRHTAASPRSGILTQRPDLVQVEKRTMKVQLRTRFGGQFFPIFLEQQDRFSMHSKALAARFASRVQPESRHRDRQTLRTKALRCQPAKKQPVETIVHFFRQISHNIEQASAPKHPRLMKIALSSNPICEIRTRSLSELLLRPADLIKINDVRGEPFKFFISCELSSRTLKRARQIRIITV